MNRLNIDYIKVDNLHRQESNPRLNAQAVEKVQASIREFGFLVPLVVDEAGQIWAGDTRYQAGVVEGMKEFPCVLADQLTEEQLKAFRIADNKVAEAAEWDMEKLTAELGAIISIDMGQFGDLLATAADLAVINDEGIAATKSFDHTLRLDKTVIVLTDEEYDRLNQRLDGYLEKHGVSFGFAKELLDDADARN